MMKNKALWVALGVFAIAAVAMIFFILPNVDGARQVTDAKASATTDAKPVDPAASVEKTTREPTVADKPAVTATAEVKPAEAVPADAKNAEAKPEEVAKTDPQPLVNQTVDAKPADATQPQAKPADPTAAWTMPGFDVLRVEPDGSTVIAGRAEPNTKLEIVNGDAVVATTEVGKTGDFAAILDNPLAPGDYQLTLRSVGQDGATKSSEEVATVSIPKDKATELLAMVSKPGEASRIITTPEAMVKPADGKTPADTTAAAPANEVIAAGKAARLAETDKAAETAQAGTTVAATSVPGASSAAAAVASAKTPVLVISAVEIEGRKIFVAGSARATALVRIYADDISVGEAKAETDGHFVVDGLIDLTVGRHIIRADMIGADGKVELRVSVPFDRPAGDQVAAVAQPAAAAVAAFDMASFEGMRADVAKAFALLKGLFAGGSVPSAENLAAARSGTEIALGALAEYKMGETIDAGMKALVTATTKAAADALALLKAVPPDATSVSAALSRVEMALASIVAPTANAADPSAAVSQSPAPATQEPQADVSTSGTEPQTVEQPPLQQSRSSVIIRRGDTLWQISRRVYGAGVRYTTIYIANEDQIIDPDKILPGQVFGVPDKAMPDAESEEIHRKHVKHQL